MARQKDRDDKVVYMGPQDDEKPTFDDKMANLRVVGGQLNETFKISDTVTSIRKGTVARLKAGALIYGIWLGAAIVSVNPILLAAVPVIAVVGAVDAYKHGSNNIIYNSYRTIKESVGLFAGDAVTLAKLPFKAAAFILGIDGKKDAPAAGDAQAPQAQQAQPEVQGAGKGFGKKLSSVFATFAPRDAAANANGLKRGQQVDITPADAPKQNVPRGPGNAG